MRPRSLSRRPALGVLATATAVGLAGCAGGRAPPSEPLVGANGRTPAYNRPYQVRGRWYSPRAQPGYDQVGVASWYGYESPGRRTADGEPFDIGVASAAHTTLPIPSWLEITNLDNGRRARVRLNDRGPFASGRLVDLSRAAAEELGFVRQGTARVRVRYLAPAEPLGGAQMWAAAQMRRPAPRSRSVETAVAAPPSDPRAEVAEDAADIDTGPSGPAPVPIEMAGAAVPLATVTARFEVQAAAFADRDNALRAVARLAPAGSARIEPMRRGDGVLYRVLVGDWPQAEAAASARSEVVALGFVDAQVIAR